jgi:hypothetical protein
MLEIRLTTTRPRCSLRTAWNYMLPNWYINMQPNNYLHPNWNILSVHFYNILLLLYFIFSFSKCNICAWIIAFRAINLVRKTFSVVFKREFFGFLHVGRLEHHAIAPVARLPKQTGKTQAHYDSEYDPTGGRVNEITKLHYFNAKCLSCFITIFYFFANM